MSPGMTHSSHNLKGCSTQWVLRQKEELPNFMEDHGTCRFFDDDRSRLSAALMQTSVM